MASLPVRDVQVLNGIPVTTPVRSILDCRSVHIGSALIQQAIADGRETGKLTAKDVAYLESILDNEASLLPSPTAALAATASSSARDVTS
jgi:hypothetical protein